MHFASFVISLSCLSNETVLFGIRARRARYSGPSFFRLKAPILWRSLEGDIVSSDSGARNLSAALYKIIQRQERDRRRELNAPNLRARLAILAGDQDRDEAAELEKLGERDLADDRRFDARDAMRLREQEAEEKKDARTND